MAYEQTYFGDGSAAGSGNVTSIVHHQYGPMQTDNSAGVTERDGFENEASWDINGTMVGNGAFDLTAPTIPAGAIIESAYAYVSEAFVLGGTSPTILVGTNGSEVTNGLVLSATAAGSVKAYDLTSTLTGTWAAPLVAETTVGIALGGTSPTVTSAGKVRIVVRYSKIQD